MPTPETLPVDWNLGAEPSVLWGQMHWNEFERALHDGVVRFVTAVIDENPGEQFTAAALDHIYRERNGVIGLPALAVRDDDDDDDDWSTADWSNYSDDWLPGDWDDELTAEASAHWQETFDRYLTTLVRVCQQARETLRTNGTDFVVVLLDDEYHETLIRRVLTADEVSRHFPELDERAAELAHIAALPPAERAVHLVGLLGTYGPVNSEDAEAALRDLGPVAFPPLIDLLGSPKHAWQAAKILADIGAPDSAVIQALHAALDRTDGQRWVAVALSRLGRLDLVLDHALPPDVVVAAVAGPYTAFRDHAVTALPLDYGPLADFIERWPTYLPLLEKELAPGTGYCRITADEVKTAVEGLDSPHLIIRRHAETILNR